MASCFWHCLYHVLLSLSFSKFPTEFCPHTKTVLQGREPPLRVLLHISFNLAGSLGRISISWELDRSVTSCSPSETYLRWWGDVPMLSKCSGGLYSLRTDAVHVILSLAMGSLTSTSCPCSHVTNHCLKVQQNACAYGMKTKQARFASDCSF